ncbi:DEAD/DEAH box helicase family protein [Phascolarctobacterium sp.]|uniref:DEAD/DEAH box helicase family protein n=1 Tax=Phascolarctobacterium sp. TaxID=2049039 RepID=UPI0038667D80
MAPEIKPCITIKPMIYAYTTPEVKRHDGWTKIGYTDKQTVAARIEQQVKTADVEAKLEWDEEARYVQDPKEYFRDSDFHNYMERYHNIERLPNREWFKIGAAESHELFHRFAAHDYKNLQGQKQGSEYTLRKEQQQAVDQTVAYYNKVKNDPFASKEYLWNAKPRFGKTLTSYDFMRRIDAKNVLVVTNRPAIANSWYDDFEQFIAWQTGYLFVSECEALSGRPVLSREQFLSEASEEDSDDTRCVAFESLQGLKGSTYFGGEYDKLKWIYDMEWDLLIIDEAHEGVDTAKTDKAFDYVKRKFTLHLSGTPFKAIAMGKFGAEQIFNWTFSDEQEAKANWDKDGERESANPYETMPHMNLFTYQMSKMVQDTVNQGLDLSDDENVEYAFDLNEFFSTNNNGKFNHEADVKKFLDALVNYKKFPFSTPELRNELKHTFWILSRVDSAKAMAKLLANHPVFGNYKVVLAAGDGKVDEQDETANKKSLNKVKDAIANNDKTITLSVGQLTTGVTIPQWTAVFMLSNMRSPAEYIQAAFRAQNPWRYEKDGKYYQKENAYVFDFSPERTLIVFDEFSNSLYTSTSGGGGTKEERESNIKRLLNFFSVYAEDPDGEMVELDAAKVMSIPIAIKTEEVVNRGFMSNFLFNNLGNVFGANREAVEILKKIEPVEQQGQKNKTNSTMDDAENIHVDENGEVKIPEEIVVQTTGAIFGDKIYEKVPTKPAEEVFQPANTSPVTAISVTAQVEEEDRPQNIHANNLAKGISENIILGIREPAKEQYGLKNKEVERVEKQIQQAVQNELQRVADDYTRQEKILTIEKEKKIEQAETAVEKQAIEEQYNQDLKRAQETFVETVQTKAQEVQVQVAQQVTETLEEHKENQAKRDIENDLRAHLRGFTRTIPSFIMAYGDDKLTMANLETYPPENVFEEVTSITVEEFCYLRDNAKCFDDVVFDQSIKEFLRKKAELSNYFDETSKKDIFDYIPPQKTNQIFTPKKVVKMMVDELEKENPDIFNSTERTFMDPYMKSGLYITELVKRLYNSPVHKEVFPDGMARLKHILEKQVFGFAPSSIIYAIATSYIFGFDEEAESISHRNFFNADTIPVAKAGTLKEFVEQKIRDSR